MFGTAAFPLLVDLHQANFLTWWARRHAASLAIWHLKTREAIDLDIPVPLKDIANYLGMTGETLSRTLGELRRRQLITMRSQRGVVRFHDIRALESFCPEACQAPSDITPC
jgi:CRP-like cAMP-binding protein